MKILSAIFWLVGAGMLFFPLCWPILIIWIIIYLCRAGKWHWEK